MTLTSFMLSKKSLSNNLSGAVLAGGQGVRMGCIDKSCIKLSGTNLLNHILNIISPLFHETFIVTRTPQNHKNIHFRMVNDIYQERSSLTGIHSALVNSKTEFVFITACDSPFLKPEFIKKLISYHDKDVDVLLPVHENGRIEPLCAIYSKKCIPFIEENLSNNIFQIKKFFLNVRLKKVELENLKKFDPNLETLININTPQELLLAQKRFKDGHN